MRGRAPRLHPGVENAAAWERKKGKKERGEKKKKKKVGGRVNKRKQSAFSQKKKRAESSPALFSGRSRTRRCVGL